mmetsp:Transcript_779/g.1646  ORF Transcript_779/g.1646 Transcript_779/m.1646 type:complete len:399 (-) Transcript_779:603-1799(-)
MLTIVGFIVFYFIRFLVVWKPSYFLLLAVLFMHFLLAAVVFAILLSKVRFVVGQVFPVHNAKLFVREFIVRVRVIMDRAVGLYFDFFLLLLLLFGLAAAASHVLDEPFQSLLLQSLGFSRGFIWCVLLVMLRYFLVVLILSVRVCVAVVVIIIVIVDNGPEGRSDLSHRLPDQPGVRALAEHLSEARVGRFRDRKDRQQGEHKHSTDQDHHRPGGPRLLPLRRDMLLHPVGDIGDVLHVLLRDVLELVQRGGRLLPDLVLDAHGRLLHLLGHHGDSLLHLFPLGLLEFPHIRCVNGGATPTRLWGAGVVGFGGALTLLLLLEFVVVIVVALFVVSVVLVRRFRGGPVVLPIRFRFAAAAVRKEELPHQIDLPPGPLLLLAHVIGQDVGPLAGGIHALG